MVRKFLLIFHVLMAMLLMSPGMVQAVAVGKIEVASHLGEPFFAEIPLLLENDEVISNVSIDIATAEDYRTLEVYRDPVLKKIKVWLKTDARGSRVEVNSNSPIDTPFFNLVLKIHYGHATHFKKYVVFLELPAAGTAYRSQQLTSQPAAKTTAKTTATEPHPAAGSSLPAAVTAAAVGKTVTATEKSSVGNTTPAAKQAPDHAVPAASGGDTSWARISRYGPMVRGDTLTTVAQRLRIDDTFTNAQVMVALFEKNRAKFGEDNMNLIRAGTFLEVPTAAEVRRHSASESSRILMAHNARWKKLIRQPKYADIARAQKNRYRKRVRVGSSASGKAAKLQRPGAASKPVVAKGGAAVSKPSATAKTLAGTAGAAATAATARVRALEAENKQLKAKLGELEAQLAKQQQRAAELAALEARNKKLELRIARLQAELEKVRKGEAAPATAAEAEKKTEKKAEVKAATKPVEQPKPESATTTKPAVVSGPAPAVVKPVAEQKQEGKPAPKPATPASAEKAEMTVFGLPMLWVAGGLVLLLMILAAVVFLVMRKRKAAAAATAAAGGAAVAAASDDAFAGEEPVVADESSEFDASEMEAAELLAAADAAKARQSGTGAMDAEDEFAQTIGGTRTKVDLPEEQIPALTDEDTSEFDAFVEKDEAPSADVDYLTEADVYLRYGMEDEAEEQVQMALKLNKADPQAHIKMLQVRHAKGEQKGIEDAIAQARGVLSGSDLEAFEAEVTELGIDASDVAASVAGEETLEIGEDEAESTMNAMEADSTAEVDMSAVKQEQESNELDFDIGDIDLGSVGTDAAMASAAATAESSDELDFDFDGMDMSSPSDNDPVTTHAEQATSSVAAENTDEFDFDLGDMDLSMSDAGDEQAAKIGTDTAESTSADVGDELDFDLGELDATFSGQAADSGVDVNTSAADDDSGFDLGEIEASTVMDAVEPAARQETNESSVENLDDMSFDLGDDADLSASSSLTFSDDALDVDDDLSMLEMNFDDVAADGGDDEQAASDETIVADFSAGSESDGSDSDFESLDFISTITMESKKDATTVDLGEPDVEKSLDSMSMMVDDITPALDSMETEGEGDDDLTKTLSTMSMLVDDMDTSEISVDADKEAEMQDDEPLDLSLSTGDLDVSLQTQDPLKASDSDEPDLTSLLGELEEITGLNDVPKKD